MNELYKNVGAHVLEGGRCLFRVWSPFAGQMGVCLGGEHGRCVPLAPEGFGYWSCEVPDVLPGTRYFFRINDTDQKPDPASFSQPEGVHGPSAVVDHRAFSWTDDEWKGLPLAEMVMYEIHPGTFTSEGTFEAIIRRLAQLQELGVNTISLMPVAQFPGRRNWGYDGVYPFAVQDSYGGVTGLKRLVDACHRRAMACMLDVVYNHLGPEGNYTHMYAPYFTSRYHTPWGDAVNYDDAYSYGVRGFVLQNARYWFEQFHFDGLRLDAVHGIYDRSAAHILEELARETEKLSLRAGRKLCLIPESDLNDTRLLLPAHQGGYGLDAQWSDDFHHAVHTALTGEEKGYYRDFGSLTHVQKAFQDGFVYSGEYSECRKRIHGSSSREIPGSQFVVYLQNHDQVGNRMCGERLSTLVSFEAGKLAAGLLFFAPYIPLIFMGEEYAEDNPFLYFIDHADPDLVEAVRRGRKEEFSSFRWEGEPPDPKAEATFRRSVLDWEKQNRGKHRVMREFYRELIAQRRSCSALAQLRKENVSVSLAPQGHGMMIRRGDMQEEAMGLFSFHPSDVIALSAGGEQEFVKLVDSADPRWKGPGSLLPRELRGAAECRLLPCSFAWYKKKKEDLSGERLFG
ncbi:MAG: malto-oligosyltrehalose trehalohydrolase [Candidatus Omnitrophica bacterium]|nr:malto-oligosyltrehalose trehalohydrolase [Candidatus Omnitrophota bacterium]